MVRTSILELVNGYQTFELLEFFSLDFVFISFLNSKTSTSDFINYLLLFIFEAEEEEELESKEHFMQMRSHLGCWSTIIINIMWFFMSRVVGRCAIGQIMGSYYFGCLIKWRSAHVDLLARWWDVDDLEFKTATESLVTLPVPARDWKPRLKRNKFGPTTLFNYTILCSRSKSIYQLLFIKMKIKSALAEFSGWRLKSKDRASLCHFLGCEFHSIISLSCAGRRQFSNFSFHFFSLSEKRN